MYRLTRAEAFNKIWLFNILTSTKDRLNLYKAEVENLKKNKIKKRRKTLKSYLQFTHLSS